MEEICTKADPTLSIRDDGFDTLMPRSTLDGLKDRSSRVSVDIGRILASDLSQYLLS